jgi:hypothetical protein
LALLNATEAVALLTEEIGTSGRTAAGIVVGTTAVQLGVDIRLSTEACPT